MWNSLPTALISLLILSDTASARHRHLHRRHARAVKDYESSALPNAALPVQPSPVLVLTTFTVIPMPVVATPAVIQTSFTAIPLPIAAAPALVEISFTAIPQPTIVPEPSLSSTNSNPSFPTGTEIPSGVFFGSCGKGTGTGTGTGSSLPCSTGISNGNATSNRTHHHSVEPRPVNSTSIPFFTLQESTTSSSAPTFATFEASPIAITSAPYSIFPTPIISIPSTFPAIPFPTPSIPSSNPIPFLRGVNLGGWLVLEKWMNPDAFSGDFANANDQFSFDSISGAADALEEHWSTFFVESDIQTLAATGLNALRIPIGFWAYDNADTPYLQGADAYLEQAIDWARNSGMYVWVDLHGSPGSQNGFDNSGHAGAVDWQQPANLLRSISVLKTMAAKYGSNDYADVVVGLQLVNEPISWGNNNFNVTQRWAQDAYAAVKAEVENENLVIVMHDAFQGAAAWTDIGARLNAGSEDGAKTFGIDSHLYQLFTDADNVLTQAQHIAVACDWASGLAAANEIMPTYVGEWSAATNICVNPDGSTTSGTTCSTEGCQCQIAPMEDWSDLMIEQVRRYVEAQLDVFESSSSGYFIWSAKAPGGWGFLNGIGNGAIPNPVTSRKYGGQCDEGKRRMGRGESGRKGLRV